MRNWLLAACLALLSVVCPLCCFLFTKCALVEKASLEAGEAHAVLLRKSSTSLLSSDTLLCAVFPKRIIEHLKAGTKVPFVDIPQATVFFSDIVGYTQICSTMSATKVGNMLDRLVCSLDRAAEKHEIFKVETIGDAFMACSNMNGETDSGQVCRVAAFAIEAVKIAHETLVDLDDPERGFLDIRVGLHSGKISNGVVGNSTPRLTVFGDAVNVASRMETNSEPGRINMSNDTACLLQRESLLWKMNPRGPLPVKGKGLMRLWWLDEECDAPWSISPSHISDRVWRRGSIEVSHAFERSLSSPSIASPKMMELVKKPFISRSRSPARTVSPARRQRRAHSVPYKFFDKEEIVTPAHLY